VPGSLETLSLFEEPEAELKAKLRGKLARLAEKNIFVGTSSWKYEGWLGQIYTPERYQVRGKFSKKRFDQECLAEYAETFRAVCGDFSFYQFPTVEFWRKLFTGSPAQLQFAFKAPEEITVPVFPSHPRYGARAGRSNPNFLNQSLLESAFLGPLEPYAHRAPVVILEFSSGCGKLFSPDAFAEHLERFLAQLPSQFRYAVEVRNAEYLDPVYFGALRRHRVAHVLNAWSRMPILSEQLQHRDVFTTDLTIARALLRRGRNYDEAVRRFSPYRAIQDPYHDAREALRELIRRAESNREPVYLFVNNRLEGNAPQTIEAILESEPE
jgi:uncharacterized protein YecE (DUF72 family)